MGGKQFSTYSFPKELIEETRKTDPEEARRMEAFNRLRNALAARSRQQKKAEEAKSRPRKTLLSLYGKK